jgi:hypothetical protein
MVQYVQVRNYQLIVHETHHLPLFQIHIGLTSTSLDCTESARLFTREGIRCAACIFVSITTYTRRSVKTETYLLTIGQFHVIFGRGWRMRRRPKSEAE